MKSTGDLPISLAALRGGGGEKWRKVKGEQRSRRPLRLILVYLTSRRLPLTNGQRLGDDVGRARELLDLDFRTVDCRRIDRADANHRRIEIIERFLHQDR